MKTLFLKKKKKKIIKLKHSFSKAIIKTKSNSTFKSNKGPKKLNESIKKLKIQMPCKCFEHKLKIYKSKTKRNSKTQQNEKIQPGQISSIHSINHGYHFNHMHEKAIKTQKTLTYQFSS